ncbi:MAG: hypothetical protein HYY24_20335 [Verrucomicrobia bacterium]|nr:hypothetical protein [Verrucomicrobiota bacterium]
MEHSRRLCGLTTTPLAILLVEDDGKLAIWDPAGRGRIAWVPVTWSPYGDVELSTDRKWLAHGRGRTAALEIVDLASGQEIALFQGCIRKRFSPDNRILACSTETGTILLWDVSTRSELCRLLGHSLRVDGLAFSRDASRLASASADGSVRLWHTADCREVATLRAGVDAFWSVAFSPDNRRLAAGTGDGRVVLWDLTTRQHVATFRVQPGGMVGHVHFTPDGRALLALGTQTMTRWRASPR